MMEDWEICKMGEVFDVRDGTHDSPKYQDAGYPLITSKNLKDGEVTYNKVKFISEEDYHQINKRSKVSVGDVLFAMIGTIGNPVVITTEPDYAIKNVALFKVDGVQDSAFLKYYLESPSVVKKMESEAKGTTQRFVGLRYLRNFPIPIPPLPEQKRIVAILDEAFEAIDQAKANIERNIENAEELFQSKLNEIFSQKGQGWEEKKINEIGKTARNIKWEEIDGERKYIDLSSVSRDSLSITDTELINRDNAPSRAKKIVKNKDVLFGTTRPTLKRVTIIDEEYSNQICSTGFYVIRPDRNIITSEWVFLFLQTKAFMDRMKKIQSGTSYPAVTYGDMKNSVIRFPSSLKEQQSLSSQLFELRNEKTILVDTYKSKLTALNELKKSILQKAFSGELTANETVAV